MLKAELSVKVLRLSIGDEAYVCAFGNTDRDELHDLFHDSLAEPFALVFGQDCDVHDLVEAATVSNYSTHPYRLVSK